MTAVATFTIHEMPKAERPRERLKNYGAQALSNPELLAIVLGSGTRRENVLNMATRILSRFSLDELSRASPSELEMIPGIKEAKACQIAAIFEIARRFQTFTPVGRPRMAKAEDVYNQIFPRLKGVNQEHFVVLYLDTKNRLIKDVTVSIGDLNSSIVHPRDVFRGAIKSSAASVILVHNHPSGDPTPSSEDKLITETLADTGRIVGINVLDHVIVGSGGYVSMKDLGVM
jgi:DNA repair protein RadC